MKVFLDSEFLEDGRTIDLISIGLVREDGEELYLIADFDEARVRRESDWLVQNVLKYIPSKDEVARHPLPHIKELVENFLWDIEKPELWGYYCDYDWVVFCRLWGRMIDLPEKFPHYCRDLKQLADERGARLKQPEGIEHHALADARWIKDSFFSLEA